MIIEIFTSNANQTKKLGIGLAKKMMKRTPLKRALILALRGGLGGGKTTFLQGFAKGLGVKEKILSPTFVILKRFGRFYHVDCYRVEKPKELLALGFKEIVANSKNIVAVEWADKVKKIIPEDAVWLSFEFIGKNKRKIVVELKDGRQKTSYYF
jgi:tRNA threonylcarbamoyladenosine biosynthesis protein TsaE